MELYLDIETLPQKEAIDPTTITAVGNRKDPIKIAIYQKEAAEGVYRKTALDPFKGRILCIGYAVNNNDSDFMYNYTDDDLTNDSALRKLGNMLDKIDEKTLYTMDIIGHNIQFDWLYVYNGLRKLGYTRICRILPNNMRDVRLRDTMKLATLGAYGEYVQLDKLAKYLGLKGKSEGIDGSKVYDTWLEGNNNKIIEYCKNDVDLTRKIYNILTLK
jgi:hypothetical protein